MAAKRLRKDMKKKIVVIPARMDSFRLPGKPMMEAAGKPLVQWTYERAEETEADYVIVATGDAEISRHCEKAGMFWVSTKKEHPNGTSRIAEVFASLNPEVRQRAAVVVNWQVDEPLVNPSDVDTLMSIRISSMGTLVCSNEDKPLAAYMHNLNVTKVVWSNNRCHWFSRAPMQGAGFHVGLYSFSPFLLQAMSLLKPSRLSILESLEQLTWIENGFDLSPIEIKQMPLSIDTPEDWVKFKKMKEDQA